MNFYYELNSIINDISNLSDTKKACLYMKDDMITVIISEDESVIYHFTDDISNIEDKAMFVVEIKKYI